MITLTFQQRGVIVKLMVKDKRVFISSGEFSKQNQYLPEEAIFLLSRKNDLLREFPDLEDKSIDDIREEALRRFRVKIESFDSEEAIADYLVSDLAKHGYILMNQENG
jgi:hypothetical protein